MTNINASAHESVFLFMMAVGMIWNMGLEILRNEAEILAKSPNTLPKLHLNRLVTRLELFTTHACRTRSFYA